MTKKTRLDEYLVEHALAEDIKTARAYIMSGIVYSKEVRLDTAGFMVGDGSMIEVRNKSLPYVSRGGLKLAKAIDVFKINLNGCVCMDIGASTGGFTDCMLQNGAKKVVAVDVGYGQLAWKLRSDSRVINMERTNIRNITRKDIDGELDFASCDVSFISLKLVFPAAHGIIKDGGKMVALIKPQFEAKKGEVGSKGVVSDIDVHIDVINRVMKYARESGFSVMGLDFSPVKGPEGNIEYLLYLCNGKNEYPLPDAAKTAENAHSTLD